MRRFDKTKNIQKANLLIEQRYLESKGVIYENYNLQNFINDFHNYEFFAPFLQAITKKAAKEGVDLKEYWNKYWNKIIEMDRKQLQDTFGLTIGNAIKLYDALQSKNQNTVDGRVTALNTFFSGVAGTGREKKWIRDMYINFKKGGDLNSLSPELKNVYLKSPGIFNFSSFDKEKFMDIVEKLAKKTNDETFLEKSTTVVG